MNPAPRKSLSGWYGVIALFIFGVLIAIDFSTYTGATAIIIGVVVAIIFILSTKWAGIELRWPKN